MDFCLNTWEMRNFSVFGGEVIIIVPINVDTIEQHLREYILFQSRKKIQLQDRFLFNNRHRILKTNIVV